MTDAVVLLLDGPVGQVVRGLDGVADAGGGGDNAALLDGRVSSGEVIESGGRAEVPGVGGEDEEGEKEKQQFHGDDGIRKMNEPLPGGRGVEKPQ